MGAAGGPNMVEDGLVFYYDTGNGKSYAGEPATNSQDPDYAAFTQAGFDAWGCYDGGSPAHTWDENQSKTYTNIPGPDGRLVDAMLYHNFTGGFHGPTHWSGVAASLLTNGSKITVQGWVKAADAASIGKTVTPYLYYNKIGGGAYSSGTGHTITSEWQLVSHSYTVPEGSTGNGTMYFFTSGGTNIKMYLTKTAIVGGKLHAVQWLPGNTTRSVTDSLKDLAGNSSIDVTNGTFNSNAQLDFDGTSGIISVPYNSNLDTPNGATYECVIYPEGAGEFLSRGKSDSGTDPDNPRFYRDGSGYIYFDWSTTGTDVYSATVVGVTPTNAWSHVVGVAEPNQALRIYVNGEEANLGNSRNTLSSTLPNSQDPIKIGGVTWIPRYFNGKVAVVKLYNRVLTDQEISNNFNGIRSRFGI